MRAAGAARCRCSIAIRASSPAASASASRLARAIVRSPAVFLMDEPLSNLDAKLRGHMRAELKHMQHELGITTIYVTHDQIEAMTLAHRVALLDKGVLQQLDTPARIYNDPANLFVAGFIGSPPMNFVEGQLAGAGASMPPASPCRRQYAAMLPGRCWGFARRIAGSRERAARSGARSYATELIGDHTLVTVKVGDAMMTVKAPKDFDKAVGAILGIDADAPAAYLFEATTGARLR